MARSTNKGRKRVTFEFQTRPGVEVAVAGSFNNWDKTAKPLKQQDEAGPYRATAMLSKGRHEYKFVINGNWCTDPANPDIVPNDQGSMNNVLIVE